jgi:hypothetical protein
MLTCAECKHWRRKESLMDNRTRTDALCKCAKIDSYYNSDKPRLAVGVHNNLYTCALFSCCLGEKR